MFSIMKRKQSFGDSVTIGIIYLILSFVLVITLYPLIIVLSSSLSEPMAIIKGEVILFPVGFNIDSYIKVLQNTEITRGFVNSVFYTVIGTAVNVIFTMLAAYPLSCSTLKGRNIFMVLITFTMFFSGGMIPTYLVVRNLNMINTIWALILPQAISTYNLIVTRTFLQNNIPNELKEAAFIDGCSNTKFFLRIVIPLSTTILVIISLFYAVAHWNEYMKAIMYLSKKEMYPLQVILRDILLTSQITDMSSSDAGMAERYLEVERIRYAVLVVASLPLIIVYPLIMKYFEKGVMLGALKG